MAKTKNSSTAGTKKAAAPVEMVLIKFPKNEFRGEIAHAVSDLVDRNIIKVIDILFVTKDENGAIDVVEATDMENEAYEAFTPLISKSGGMLDEQDAEELTDRMENNSSAGLMLFEDTWARELAEAVDRAGGDVIISERIPREALAATTE